MSKPIYLFSISSHPKAVSITSLGIILLKPMIDFNQYDYLILTSKQASEALKEYKKNDYITKKALCVSKQSAIAYENIGGTILDIGSGYGENLSLKIEQYPKEKRWLYLRGEIVASDFVQRCKEEGHTIDEAIMYKSECSQDILHARIEEDSILIFTSPSSVECFLKTHVISSLSKVIVIGKTTAKALPNNTPYILSHETSIESCIQIAQNL